MAKRRPCPQGASDPTIESIGDPGRGVCTFQSWGFPSSPLFRSVKHAAHCFQLCWEGVVASLGDPRSEIEGRVGGGHTLSPGLPGEGLEAGNTQARPSP